MQLAFIGLGTMGRPMVEHILAADIQTRCSRIKPVSEYLLERGAVAASSPAEAARDADIVILMLPDTPDVEAVLFGPDGVAETLTEGSLVIDMSSISPVATKEFARRIKDMGAGYLDAPVSGGDVGARAASLSIMAGGSEADFERALPVLKLMGKNITRVGDVGAGQVCKVANQVIVGLTIEAVSEAFLLAERAGADVAKVRDALMGGFAQSRILEVHGQRMIDGAFEPGFAMRLHRKDLNIAHDVARSLDFSLPNTASTIQLMNAGLSQGLADKDHSALLSVLRNISPGGNAAS
ncbi:2-hydroxy-3-oxopropionate reductase [Martelella mediterranea]|uniref:2-hydroxy-3-oxopropionate reductase n=1 Tax=Martelella mediterranea DSM 17316 TaxID=1122214 RepID=A0A1U9YX46_9HYPH|nr:2-hydroxy-3-oxopropionate reductase [Martelella mediterranea]AQZ49942.1 2-hydroxy-3-oxopropionate reductase [Martelella mediterranea DSM 17316]